MIFRISLYCDPGNDVVLKDAPTHCVNRESPETVAVIIVNWNTRELLGKSIVSLKSQRYQIDELIVVDNVNTDSST